MHFLNTELVIERMKNAVGLKNNKELAAFLQMPASTLSNWKSKNSMPLEVVADFAQKENLDLNMLVFGQEKESSLAADLKIALLAFNDLNDRQKLDAIAFMMGLKTQSASAISHTVNGSENNFVTNGNIHISK